jgi:hypothetical protein
LIALKSRESKEMVKPCAAMSGTIGASIYGEKNNLNLVFFKKC